jgi:lipoprotein-anchoring transpeptidase ErfK/SrfK
MRRACRTRRILVAAVLFAFALSPLEVGSILSSARAVAFPDGGHAFAGPIVLAPTIPLAVGAEPPRPERTRYMLVEIERALPITARPGGGRVLGTMPAGSRYYAVPTVAWVRHLSQDHRYGLGDVPYVAGRAQGWIPLRGLSTSHTGIRVDADLSEHRITVRRGDDVLFRAPAATGAPASPTPVGRYFVTDRVPFPAGGSLGTFAFGISGIQPPLPAGWSGGDQLAIHGTNAPWSIGRSASAGCLRVSEHVLDRLRPLLKLGTPVVFHP